MEDHAAETAVDHHRINTCRAGIRMQHGNGFLRCQASARFRINPLLKDLKSHARAGIAGTRLVFLSVGSHSGDHQPGKYPPVRHKHTFRVADQHILCNIPEPAGHLHNLRGNGPCRGVGCPDLFSFPCRFSVSRQDPDLFRPRCAPVAEPHRCASLAGADSCRRLCGAFHQAFPACIVGKNIDSLGTFKHPDTGPVFPGRSHGFDPS